MILVFPVPLPVPMLDRLLDLPELRQHLALDQIRRFLSLLRLMIIIVVVILKCVALKGYSLILQFLLFVVVMNQVIGLLQQLNLAARLWFPIFLTIFTIFTIVIVEIDLDTKLFVIAFVIGGAGLVGGENDGLVILVMGYESVTTLAVTEGAWGPRVWLLLLWRDNHLLIDSLDAWYVHLLLVIVGWGFFGFNIKAAASSWDWYLGGCVLVFFDCIIVSAGWKHFVDLGGCKADWHLIPRWYICLKLCRW